MGRPTLTYIAVAVVTFVGIMLLFYSPEWGILNHFMEDNAQVVPTQYANYYSNLTSQQSDLDSLTQDFESKSLLTDASSIVGGFFSAISVGFQALKVIAKTPIYLISIVNSLQEATHLPDPFFWIIITSITIVCVGLAIKAYRNQIDVP